MPLEVNSTDANHALQNIESFIQKYLEVLRYTESLPYEASAAHEDTFTTLYKRLKPYDASINLSITDRRSYTDLTHREGAMFHQTLMFCELIFFDRIQWNNKTIGKFDEFKKHFVFSKSQLPEIKAILDPLTEQHQLMYVFSELSEITNDIAANDQIIIFYLKCHKYNHLLILENFSQLQIFVKYLTQYYFSSRTFYFEYFC